MHADAAASGLFFIQKLSLAFFVWLIDLRGWWEAPRVWNVGEIRETKLQDFLGTGAGFMRLETRTK